MQSVIIVIDFPFDYSNISAVNAFQKLIDCAMDKMICCKLSTMLKAKFWKVQARIKEKFFCAITNDKEIDSVMRMFWMIGVFKAEAMKSKIPLILCSLVVMIVALVIPIFNLKSKLNDPHDSGHPIIHIIKMLKHPVVFIEFFVLLKRMNKIAELVEKILDLSKRLKEDFTIKHDADGQNALKRLMKISKIIITVAIVIMIVNALPFVLQNHKNDYFNFRERYPALHLIFLFILVVIAAIISSSFALFTLYQDLLIPVLISKVELLLHFVTKKMEKVTEFYSEEMCESELDECIEFHIEILEIRKMLGNFFNVSFFLRTFLMTILHTSAVMSMVQEKNFKFHCD